MLFVLLVGVTYSGAQKVCDAVGIGYVPLTQMTNEPWNGVLGGLYPNGSNNRPYDHDLLLLKHALTVQACKPDGSLDIRNGQIVVLGIGSSNAKSAFSSLERISTTDTLCNRSVQFLNVAQDGLGLQNVASANSGYWSEVENAVAAQGFATSQVQIAWVMIDDTENTDTVFPRAAQELADQLYDLCKTIKVKFPSVKFIHLSSRPYSGYIDPTETSLGMGHITPRDYIHGWAVKFLIERQINGSAGYAFTGAHSEIPALVWSSYLWSDGTTANSDGLSWECTDFESDGFSLATSGSEKAGRSLHFQFSQDQLSMGWYTRPVPMSVSANHESLLQVHAVVSDGAIHIASTDGDVAIMNLQGKVMWSTSSSENDIDVPTSSWPSGVYVVRSGSESELVTVR